MKKLADAAIESLSERMSVHADSRQVTKDEVSMCAMTCRIQELEGALKIFADFLEGDLKSVGGGTAVSPDMTMQPFKTAKELLA